MRKLTFEGFLRQYLRTLSGCNSLSIRKLAHLSEEAEPRLREPLFIYSTICGKTAFLNQTLIGTKLEHEFLLRTYTAEALIEMLKNKDPRLPSAYHKVWRSYCSVAQRQQTDDATKSLMRDRIIALQQERSITNYRLYTDLNLNPGNLNAWLKHGDSSKISLANARRVMHYLQG